MTTKQLFPNFINLKMLGIEKYFCTFPQIILSSKCFFMELSLDIGSISSEKVNYSILLKFFFTRLFNILFYIFLIKNSELSLSIDPEKLGKTNKQQQQKKNPHNNINYYRTFNEVETFSEAFVEQKNKPNYFNKVFLDLFNLLEGKIFLKLFDF